MGMVPAWTVEGRTMGWPRRSAEHSRSWASEVVYNGKLPYELTELLNLSNSQIAWYPFTDIVMMWKLSYWFCLEHFTSLEILNYHVV